jgi:hypothetical protein
MHGSLRRSCRRLQRQEQYENKMIASCCYLMGMGEAYCRAAMTTKYEVSMKLRVYALNEED